MANLVLDIGSKAAERTSQRTGALDAIRDTVDPLLQPFASTLALLVAPRKEEDLDSAPKPFSAVRLPNTLELRLNALLATQPTQSTRANYTPPIPDVSGSSKKMPSKVIETDPREFNIKAARQNAALHRVIGGSRNQEVRSLEADLRPSIRLPKLSNDDRAAARLATPLWKAPFRPPVVVTPLSAISFPSIQSMIRDTPVPNSVIDPLASRLRAA